MLKTLWKASGSNCAGYSIPSGLGFLTLATRMRELVGMGLSFGKAGYKFDHNVPTRKTALKTAKVF